MEPFASTGGSIVSARQLLKVGMTGMLVGLLLAPVFSLLQWSTAKPPVKGGEWRYDLILPPGPVLPALEALKRIDRSLVASYVTQKGDNLWSLGKKLNFSRDDMDTVRS